MKIFAVCLWYRLVAVVFIASAVNEPNRRPKRNSREESAQGGLQRFVRWPNFPNVLVLG